MTYAGLIELLERLRANAEEHGRHRDVIEIGEAVKLVMSPDLLKAQAADYRGMVAVNLGNARWATRSR